ncbi:MAG: hypothetical protein AAF490_03510 [Chloroflexota bacterium]
MQNFAENQTTFKLKRLIGFELPLPWQQPAYTNFSDAFQIQVAEPAFLNSNPNVTLFHTSRYVLLANSETAVSENARVIVWERPSDDLPLFEKIEYVVPKRRLHFLGIALTLRPKRLIEFEKWRIASTNSRDFLVFGSSKEREGLRKDLRTAVGGNGRVWQAMALDQRPFMPVMVSLPAGAYWQKIEEIDPEIGRIHF